MDQRRTRRFQLQLPLSITRFGAERVSLIGCTKNISSSGVLFLSQREPDLGVPIEYIVTMNQNGSHSTRLRCIGKILRTNRVEGEEGPQLVQFQVAATLERYEFVRELARTAKGMG